MHAPLPLAPHAVRHSILALTAGRWVGGVAAESPVRPLPSHPSGCPPGGSLRRIGMSASRFAAQLRLARISDEFYDAYTRYVLNPSARERELVAELLGPNAEAVSALNEFGQPLARERLAEF